MMRRARMIVNPLPFERRAAGRLSEVVAALEDGGISVEVSFTRLGRTCTDLARRAAAEGYDLVVAAGGDGTVREVGEGLLDTRVPLGILPVGTFNNVAHGLSIPMSLDEALETVLHGVTRLMDVGMANGTPFFESAGVGLDASLLVLGEDIKSGRYERLLEAGLAFFRQAPTEMLVTTDGQERAIKAPLVVVANGPYYGAGFCVAPEATTCDGLLDVAVFDCGVVEIARQFALSTQNRTYREACLSVYRAREVTIAPSIPLPAHADGKPLGDVPLACQVRPGALQVIVPSSADPLDGTQDS